MCSVVSGFLVRKREEKPNNFIIIIVIIIYITFKIESIIVIAISDTIWGFFLSQEKSQILHEGVEHTYDIPSV